MNGTMVEVEGIKYGKTVNIKTLMNFAGSEELESAQGSVPEEGNDPTSTAARIGVESVLDGQVVGEGVLPPEVCFDPINFIERFVADTPVTLSEQTTITGEFTK